MICNTCKQLMEKGNEGYRPSMCPNVEYFMDFALTDSLTGKTYEPDSNPIHCTQSHVNHIALVDTHFEGTE